ncbi:hypothetical protein MYX65_07800 [Acidobacteria bacterium AH-259-L09]|nr:hypothetical protein [Acidobacteria bacterium AH-259-L09]
MGRGDSGLYRVSAAGGTPEKLTTPDAEKGEIGHLWPEILPGGEAVLFSIWTGTNYSEARIAVLSLETGEWKTLLEGGSYPRYSPTGHLLYVRSETLLAVPFDSTTLEVKGDPVPMLRDLPVNSRGVSHFAFSGDGMLVYWPGQTPSNRSLVWVDREGQSEPVTEIRRAFEYPRLSPDGKHLAVTVVEGADWDVWIYEIARGILTPVTFESRNHRNIWTPDGKRLTFVSNRRGGGWESFWKPIDGSGEAEPLHNRLILRGTFLMVSRRDTCLRKIFCRAERHLGVAGRR